MMNVTVGVWPFPLDFISNIDLDVVLFCYRWTPQNRDTASETFEFKIKLQLPDRESHELIRTCT